jgi:5'-3' exoribonuclease 2
MGVPAFFRWLSRKYPQIIVNAQEEGLNGGDEEHSVDASQPNPNEVEFDNLYLDMNGMCVKCVHTHASLGIIHPCCHPEGRPPPANEDEMMLAIFEAIDRFFNIVRPRRVLYMAIDGVAPRAKMNQQRSRRFRACKESRDLRLAVASKREELMTLNALVPDEKPASAHFDSNCITPGTPFMARLSDNLHYYIRRRIATNPAWANIQVILSDANVPGEGEHKIMDYIRRQRASPDHDPNTQHCLCGADADLIMLGLATHEPNFTIIREEFVPGPKQTPCSLCKAYGHELKNCPGIEETEGADPVEAMPTRDHGYIFVRLAVLREYLAKELQMDVPFAGGFDLERAIDDWVFMCFFVGNDFLPHLPSLEIRERE